jgi:hypothetical protein
VTDHDLLIRMSEQMDIINLLLTNHLHHHFLYTMAMFAAFLSLIGGLVLCWLRTGGKSMGKRLLQ